LAAQQTTIVIGLLIEAFGFDPIAYCFASSRERYSAIVLCSKIRARRPLGWATFAGFQQLAVGEFHDVLLNP
jgi:hypothetical protein